MANNQWNQEEIEKHVDELKRTVRQGASEVQQRVKRVVDKANEYVQQAQTMPMPQQPSSTEEAHIRQLANHWGTNNWRVARDLGTYMDHVSWSTHEVWELTLQTRWETRQMTTATEPYTGRSPGELQPLLPIWDYTLPLVSGLKPPVDHIHIDGLDELLSCAICNGTGRTSCATCVGRGWSVCPDCRGRTKKRCTTCRGRSYVADWASSEKKLLFKQQAEKLVNTVSERMSAVFEEIQQQGVPIPNPIDTDPARRGQTIPCSDCVNGEVNCSCSNGKRVCVTCQGAKSTLCTNCSGTGKILRHQEIARSFDLHTQTHFVGKSDIPEHDLAKAHGELVYSNERLDFSAHQKNDTLHPDVPAEGIPLDVWQVTTSIRKMEDAREQPDSQSRRTLQVVELVRIPYTKVNYCFSDQDYTFYIYDTEGNEKFYADRYPPRWDRVERLVRAISNDLMTPSQENTSSTTHPSPSYRVPVEVTPE